MERSWCEGLAEERGPHEACIEGSDGDRQRGAGGHGVHGRRRHHDHAAVLHQPERLPRPGHHHHVERVDREAGGGHVQQDLRRVPEAIPLDHREERPERHGRQDPVRDQRGESPRRRALVRPGQRGQVLHVGGVDRPHALHPAGQHGSQPVPAGRVQVHEVRQQPMCVPVPYRRVRAVLQQGHVREGRDLGAPQDDVRADGRRQETDRVQPGRLDQGRGVGSLDGLLRDEPGHLRGAVRRRMVRRHDHPLRDRHRSQVEGTAHLAEGPRGLVRRGQAQQVRRRPG